MAAQTSSNVLLRESPEQAALLMPQNGVVLEKIATQKFIAGVKIESDIAPSAKAARAIAKKSFAIEPLTPKSLGIIALAQQDIDKKNQILDLASKLNRRDLLLQGLALESHIDRKNFAEALTNLDNIVRVHPEQKSRFFPVLAESLQYPEAAFELAAILDNSSDWHGQFLEFAAKDKASLPNLVRLRLARDHVHKNIDRRLISGLLAVGEADAAHEIYLKAVSERPKTTSASDISWQSEFIPFDWKFASETGFRAQSVTSGTAIEVFVRTGEGGILAERLIALPSARAQLQISHTLTPAAQVKDVRMQISCPGDPEPVLDQPFRIRPMQIDLPNFAGRCDYARVAIYARSWSGRSPIRGEINQLKIVSK
ncbi:hypothetical protein [Pontixanthobacter sp.]|uniref:hypothetical protein n=1 Tax=Pontixanthobacter sp. TaxID=2792078 RepID=UPI003C799E0B